MALPELAAQPSLEAQVADRADEIAYTNHDLDDGLRSALLTLEQLDEVPLWAETAAATRAALATAPPAVVVAQTIVALINRLVGELVEATAARLAADPPADVEALRQREQRLLDYPPATARALRELKQFLFENLYHHPRVVRMTRKAERTLSDLWRVYREDPRQLPRHVTARFGEEGAARATADYLAGMTDRFALAEHRKLLDPHEPVA